MVEWQFIDTLATQFGNCKIVDASTHQWCYEGRLIAWERPLSKKDLAALGENAPAGKVLAVHMPDIETRDAWANSVSACFVSNHFKTYPAVLVDLEKADEQLLRELFDEGFEAAKSYLDTKRASKR